MSLSAGTNDPLSTTLNLLTMGGAVGAAKVVEPLPAARMREPAATHLLALALAHRSRYLGAICRDGLAGPLLLAIAASPPRVLLAMFETTPSDRCGRTNTRHPSRAPRFTPTRRRST
jgi:hypothetical protein